MKIACYIKKVNLRNDPSVLGAMEYLRNSGLETYDLLEDGLRDGTSLIVCFGGDGTILSVAPLACANSVPVIGINMGRLGFLSDDKAEDVLRMIVGGDFHVDERRMLSVCVKAGGVDGEVKGCFTALNDVSVRRSSAGTMGVDVNLNGAALPTYWADGVLLCTSCGSTAYNLSAGGPIVLPESDVFVLSPIAPHNLNMRPLVIPATSELTFTVRNFEKLSAQFSVDNHEFPLSAGDVVCAKAHPVPLKLASTGKSNFIQALQSKLFWGEDVRNIK